MENEELKLHAFVAGNAAQEFILSMLIFKRKRMTDPMRGGSPNTLYTCSESSWIMVAPFVE